LVTQYYRVAADGIHFAGSDDGTSVIVHAPQGKFIAFPCTFGTSWNSPQNASFSYDETPVTRTGTFSGHADGYGTLVMPGGTVPNVLRVHWTHTLQDATPFFTISYIYDSYAFFVAGQPHPIVELVTASTDVGGGPIVNQFSRWSGDITTAIDAPQVPAFGVFPNPASDQVNISLPIGSGSPSSITVTDMTGRTVLHELLSGTRTNTARFDVSSLFSGQYQVTVTTTDGRRHTTSLIVR
jgi:Secretion system C-terminal sorting domain